MTTFNGVNLDELVKVEDIRVDVLPPVSIDTAEGTSRSWFRRKTFEMRAIEIDMRIIDTSHEAVVGKAKLLAAALNVDEPKELITRRRPDEYILAIPQGSTGIDQLLHTGGVTVTFISDEGVYYSTTFYENLSSGTNNGTLPAKPVLKFTATGSTRTISNGTQSLYFEGLTSGDVVIIDTSTGVVTVNGASGNVYETLESRSDLFELPVGAWSLTGATATFRERSL
jgi:predicted phage tail component-like protein